MKLIIKAKFDAAHHIPGHDKCGRVHGHTYHIEMEFTTIPPNTEPEEYESGIAIDFGKLKDIIQEYLLTYYDHNDLNTLLQLPVPTAEHIAKHIFIVLSNTLKLEEVEATVTQVTVWETESCGVRYP
jgi:6-pyruvoyltetrahydropterin/6-carboxytetrahydropterin synthase